MEHINHLISDYVLDLLPARDKVTVEQHAAACPHCRQLLQAERHLAHLTRETVMMATTPAPARLAALMPPPRIRHHARYTTFAWQRSLAIAGVFLFLLVTSLHPVFNPGWAAQPSPTHISATATATPIPATATHTLTVAPLTSTTRPETMPSPSTPTGQATPIAFLMNNPQ
jgi:anti-sigma factor RsiW